MESEFIARLRTRLPVHRALRIGPGDDAALVDLEGRSELVVTTDMLMDGVDFHAAEVAPQRIGRKALSVNLSDLAAMAARPVAAVVSVALPRDGGWEFAERMYDGLIAQAVAFDTALAGGDTNSWDGPAVISITAFGVPHARGVWRRSGARPGDAVVVTGEFGGSLLDKHFDFTPRVREALLLAERYDVRAAIDVSDGLSLDLHRLAVESRCGVELDVSRVPIADAARAAAAVDTRSPLEHALGDGEDFELILALSTDEAERLCREQPLHGVPLTCIGRCVAEPGLWQIDAAGRRSPLAPRGYEHRMTR